MANSPHPVLLGPLGRELEARGHRLLITGRDHAQTRELTLGTWPDAIIVGDESPAARSLKARVIAERVVALRRAVRGLGAEVAVSLGSYAQIIAARSMGLPVLTLMDYEYQPANHVSFRLAHRVVVPRVFPAERLRHFGVRDERIARFEGFKEEVYLDQVDAVPIAPPTSRHRTRAVFRPPPEGALYHQHGNDMFESALRVSIEREETDVVVLPRVAGQRKRYAAMPGVSVPDVAVNGLALLRSADVFVGAGGTMSREAALLGVRAYTMFAGRLGAVDAELIRQGSLLDLRVKMADGIDWSPRDGGDAVQAREHRRRRGQELRAWLATRIEELL